MQADSPTESQQSLMSGWKDAPLPPSGRGMALWFSHSGSTLRVHTHVRLDGSSSATMDRPVLPPFDSTHDTTACAMMGHHKDSSKAGGAMCAGQPCIR